MSDLWVFFTSIEVIIWQQFQFLQYAYTFVLSNNSFRLKNIIIYWYTIKCMFLTIDIAVKIRRWTSRFNKSLGYFTQNFGYCILEVDLKTNTFQKTINLILSRTASVVFIFETIEVVTNGSYDAAIEVIHLSVLHHKINPLYIVQLRAIKQVLCFPMLSSIF